MFISVHKKYLFFFCKIKKYAKKIVLFDLIKRCSFTSKSSFFIKHFNLEIFTMIRNRKIDASVKLLTLLDKKYRCNIMFFYHQAFLFRNLSHFNTKKCLKYISDHKVYFFTNRKLLLTNSKPIIN